MSSVLVKYSYNYADEFDIEGFCIMDYEEHEQDMKEVTHAFNENGFYEYHFGSNESVVFESLKEYENGITVSAINEEEEVVISKFLGLSFGICRSY